MVGLGRRELHKGVGNCPKYLRRGWNRKEESGNKNFKKGGKLGQGVGALKGEGLEPPYKLWQCQLPPLSFKISTKDTFFHISINSIRLYLFLEYLLIFFWILCILPWLGKIFKFMVFPFLKHALNLDIFPHAYPQSKLSPCNFFRYDGLTVF